MKFTYNLCSSLSYTSDFWCKHIIYVFMLWYIKVYSGDACLNLNHMYSIQIYTSYVHIVSYTILLRSSEHVKENGMNVPQKLPRKEEEVEVEDPKPEDDVNSVHSGMFMWSHGMPKKTTPKISEWDGAAKHSNNNDNKSKHITMFGLQKKCVQSSWSHSLPVFQLPPFGAPCQDGISALVYHPGWCIWQGFKQINVCTQQNFGKHGPKSVAQKLVSNN